MSFKFIFLFLSFSMTSWLLCAQIFERDLNTDTIMIKNTTIKTPLGDSVAIEILPTKEIETRLKQESYNTLESIVMKGRKHNVFQSRNGQVICRYGKSSRMGYLFDSLKDLNKVYDTTNYYKFQTRFKLNDALEPVSMKFYYFDLKDHVIQRLLQQSPELVPALEREEHLAYRFKDQTYLYLFKLSKNSGRWFSSEEHLRRFIEGYYVEEEMFPKLDIDKKLWLTKDRRSTIRRVSPELVSSYLKDTSSEITDLPDFLDDSQKSYTTSAHQLQSGKVLLVWDPFTIILFENESDFHNVLAQYEKESYDQEIFFHSENQAVFESIVPKSIQVLHEAVEIPLDQLDYTSKSLKLLDKHVYAYYSEPGLQREILLPLIAYFGEVLIHETQGKAHWEIRQRPQQGYWEPIIITDTGKEYEFMISIVKSLENQEYAYPFCASCLYLALDLVELFHSDKK